MKSYIVELTDVEVKAMEYVTVDINEWVQNAVHERSRVAIEELVRDTVNHNLQQGIPLSGSKDEIVLGSPLLPLAQRDLVE